LYWRDSGLLHALLGVEDMRGLLGQPWVGFSWEGFVIEQIVGVLQHLDRRANPCFFRTSDGYEIDLLFEANGAKWAVEVKLTTEPSPEDISRLNQAADMVGADRRILITQSQETTISGARAACNLASFLQILKK
jgi:predicted AAA+ superfamily ATPase